MCFNQIMGIVGIVICDSFRTYLKRYKFLTNLFCIALFLISLVSLFFVNSKLVRTGEDIQQIKEEKSDEKKEFLIEEQEDK